jgi:hypothetical protein
MRPIASAPGATTSVPTTAGSGSCVSLCPGVPLVALSATAAPRVRADIIRLLQLRRPLIQVRSARRANLAYAMQRRGRPIRCPWCWRRLRSGARWRC